MKMVHRWGAIILLFVFVLVGSFFILRRMVKESGYQEVANSSVTYENEELAFHESLKKEWERILQPYDVLSDYMIHYDMNDNVITKVEITAECTKDLDDWQETLVKEQLAEYMGISADNIFIEYVLLSDAENNVGSGTQTFIGSFTTP